MADTTLDASAEPTDDSADEPVEHVDAPGDRSHRELAMSAVLAVLVGALAALMYATHRSGHWWGDDWALYLRQAEGLLDGHPNRVLQENEFTVTRSNGSEFSPPLYPWGFPIMLVPFIAVVGSNVDRLTVVPVLCACVFACCWYSLARKRVGYVPALVGVAAVTVTPLLLSWTELIQSEWPFLAVTFVALMLLDRLAWSGVLAEARARVAPLVVVGFAAAAVFTVRREGLAMIGAVGIAQLAALVGAGAAPWRPFGVESRALLARLAVPHVTFLATVGLLQVTLPSTVVPKYDGTSVTNVWTLRGRLVRNLAQVSGLQRPWDKDPIVLGSRSLGWWLLGLYLLLAVAGIMLAVVRYRTRDLHLAAYAVAAFIIGGSFRSPINRYVATVAPVLMLLALVAVHAPLRRYVHPRLATAVVTVALVAIVAGNAGNAKLRMEGAKRADDAGAIEWGPTHPDALAMFDEVLELSEPGDIIAAPKARAMVWKTGRPSIQIDDYRSIPDDVDIALIVIEQNQDRNLYAIVSEEPDRYTPVWANSRFTIFEPVG